MTTEDRDLVARAQAGDEVAFELLVRRHTEQVWRLARSLLRDTAAAEDAVQETFIKVHRSIGEFRGDASFKTWVLQITHRTCLDQLRRSREVVPLDEVRERRARDVDTATRIVLEQAVAALPEDERNAFMLVDALGLSREEAAVVVGVPASTLKSRLARAHARLVEALEGTTTTKTRKTRKR